VDLPHGDRHDPRGGCEGYVAHGSLQMESYTTRSEKFLYQKSPDTLVVYFRSS
jgi:hypothetical protein